MKNFLRNNSDKRWLVKAIILISFFVVIGILIFGMDELIISIYAGIGLALTVILYIVDTNQKEINTEIKHGILEVQSSVGVNKFLDTKLPQNMGGWALSSYILSDIISEVFFRKPGIIVECGSGVSTTVIASSLKKFGKGKIISLDHLSTYAQKTKRNIEIEGLEDSSEVLFAPLRKFQLDKGEFFWYETDELFKILKGKKIDMLIVDGPPKSLQRLSRYPAVPILKDYLSENCLVILDDANRKDEKQSAEIWANTLGYDSFHDRTGIGFIKLAKRS